MERLTRSSPGWTGSDPAHARKRARLLGEQAHSPRRRRRHPLWRLRRGRLVRRLAAALRALDSARIHIVADQSAAGLPRAHRAHRAGASACAWSTTHDVFTGYEQYLPTFSNRSIEAMLHRVPGNSRALPLSQRRFHAAATGGRRETSSAATRWCCAAAGATAPRARAGNAGARRCLKLAARHALRRRRWRGRGQHQAQQLSGAHGRLPGPLLPVPALPGAAAPRHHPPSGSRRTRRRWSATCPSRLRSAEQFLTVALANHLEISRAAARSSTTAWERCAGSPGASRKLRCARNWRGPALDPALAFLW